MKDKQLENLIFLRNELFNTNTANRLLDYLQDYITREACIVNRNSDTIKGMCEIVQRIKEIPSKIDKIKE